MEPELTETVKCHRAAMSNPNGLLSQNYVTIVTRAAH